MTRMTMVRHRLWSVGLLLSSCISGQAQGISPVLTQPPPERLPSVKEEGVVATRPVSPQAISYGMHATIAVSDEIRRREQAATERWKHLRRERFIDDVSKLDGFATFIGTTGTPVAGITPETRAIVRKRAKETAKIIPRIIKYIGGKPINLAASQFRVGSATEAVFDISARLARTNAKLAAIGQEKYPEKPTGNDDVVAELNVVRTTLELLQRLPF
jgi:hypothetical protein